MSAHIYQQQALVTQESIVRRCQPQTAIQLRGCARPIRGKPQRFFACYRAAAREDGLQQA
jgi:hypothetical protein